MDPLELIEAESGFFSRPEAKNAGYADRDITRMVRRRAWIRIRRGAYVFADTWATLDEVARHRVRCRAVLRSLGEDVALSHVSGAVAHGIDCWGVALGQVHVTRLDGGAGRMEGDVVHHEGFCLDEDVVVVDGMRTLRPERCVLEAGSRASSEAALCLFESGLRAGRYDEEQLTATYRLLEHWPFMHHVAPWVAIADGRSGSVGESRGKYLFKRAGLPDPEPQFEVRRADGSIVGTCDWCWPQLGSFGEFDGKVKYGRLLKPGQDPGDAVFAEKRREDELRELTGFRMLRLVWSDYDTPALTLARVRTVLRLAG